MAIKGQQRKCFVTWPVLKPGSFFYTVQEIYPVWHIVAHIDNSIEAFFIEAY